METGDIAGLLGVVVTATGVILMWFAARGVSSGIKDVMHDLILLRKTAHKWGPGPDDSEWKVKE